MTSLDATCGDRNWPQPRPTISIDIDPDKNPDMVMDATDLKFPDAYFDEIYCDPPFVINGGRLQKLIGRLAFYFHRADWERFLELTEKEFLRCLKPNGRLIYKVDEGHWWGLAHYDDVFRGYLGFEIERDERHEFGLTEDNPFGNIARHIITFRKA